MSTILNADNETIKQYKESTDQDVLDFIDSVMNGSNITNLITVAFIPDAAAKEIEILTGKKVEGNRVVLDANAVRHIEKRHGVNGKQDSSMKDTKDVARMGFVVSNYDEITFSGLTTTGYPDEKGMASPMVRISKKINGTYYIVEAVNSSKHKKNYVVSAFIQKK